MDPNTKGHGQQNRLLELLKVEDLTVRKSIAIWLSGLGNINHENQSDVEFVLPYPINGKGNFLRLDQCMPWH